ncbi:hypothetical protein J6590_011966 [Homalodisca vitripennis]|nr:hypothetical protein J6590_011966 [Homalodisca vitripennis]
MGPGSPLAPGHEIYGPIPWIYGVQGAMKDEAPRRAFWARNRFGPLHLAGCFWKLLLRPVRVVNKVA